MKALSLFLVLFVGLWAEGAAAQSNIMVYSEGSVVVGQTRQLTAYVPLSPNTVTWSVDGVTGGDSTVGTISSTGLYMAPAVPPSAGQVSVRATSTTQTDRWHAVTLKIVHPLVQLWSISPASGTPGAFAISLNGSNFTPDTVVKLGDVVLSTSYVSPTMVRATGNTSESQVGAKIAVKAVRPGLGGTTSSSVFYTVASAANATPVPAPTPSPASPQITVSLSPNGSTIAPFSTRQFTATVTGTGNTSVSYSVDGVSGGNAELGTITGGGLYTAPAMGAAARTVTVRAASVASPSAAAAATITITGRPMSVRGRGLRILPQPGCWSRRPLAPRLQASRVCARSALTHGSMSSSPCPRQLSRFPKARATPTYVINT